MMKTCGICKECPAVNCGLCQGCHEDAVAFRRSPEGVVSRIIWRILYAAEEGGLKHKQSKAIGVKIIEMIRNTERTLWNAINELVEFYHHERKHLGLSNRLIDPPEELGAIEGIAACRERLGGVLRY